MYILIFYYMPEFELQFSGNTSVEMEIDLARVLPAGVLGDRRMIMVTVVRGADGVLQHVPSDKHTARERAAVTRALQAQQA